jgi:hypothetical protein
MIRTTFALSVGSRSLATSRAPERNPRRGPLECVWIPTGNPRQPLECVWMERHDVESEPAPAALEQPYRGLHLVHA